ncbi:M28 family peptidase [bacterium]|nr:M28 family peptidase [candidate division CSSED10-310 bacterium]
MRNMDLENRLFKHVKTLADEIGERSIVKPVKLRAAQDYILNNLNDYGLETCMEPVCFMGIETANIIGKTSNYRDSSKRYLVGAHYDTVESSPGADDNASGISVLLELARFLNKQFAESSQTAVKFVAFTLEEPPAFATPNMGSYIHAQNMIRADERIEGMICLEMVGFRNSQVGSQKYPPGFLLFNRSHIGNFLCIVHDRQSRELSGSLLNTVRKTSNLPYVNVLAPFKGKLVPGSRMSDHRNFWDCGYKALMITDTAFYRNPNYHTRSDTPETLDYVFMSELVTDLVTFLAAA